MPKDTAPRRGSRDPHARSLDPNSSAVASVTTPCMYMEYMFRCRTPRVVTARELVVLNGLFTTVQLIVSKTTPPLTSTWSCEPREIRSLQCCRERNISPQACPAKGLERAPLPLRYSSLQSIKRQREREGGREGGRQRDRERQKETQGEMLLSIIVKQRVLTLSTS